MQKYNKTEKALHLPAHLVLRDSESRSHWLTWTFLKVKSFYVFGIKEYILQVTLIENTTNNIKEKLNHTNILI